MEPQPYCEVTGGNIKLNFRQLIEYIHTGTVTLQPRTLLGWVFFHFLVLSRYFTRYFSAGLMNAADYYGLDELKCACSGFIQALLLLCIPIPCFMVVKMDKLYRPTIFIIVSPLFSL